MTCLSLSKTLKILTVLPERRSFDFVYNTLGGLDQVTRSLTNLEDPEAPPQIDQFQFDHDGLGRRISKKINGQIIRHYILDEQNRLVAEANPDGKIITEYVYGTLSHSPDYIIRGPNKYKLVHDQLGSVRLVVNSNTGEIVSKINYDEFGRPTERLRPGFQSIGYAGGIRVGINGLYRFGARDYDPSIGRWTAKDPILFNGGDTNLYGYVLGDPVNFIDPSGLWRWPPDIYNDSHEDARNAFPDDPSGSQDTYRHCLASCIMTYENGSFSTWSLGTLNEYYGDLKNGQSSCERDRDLSNNEMGDYFGRNANDASKCHSKCRSFAESN